MSEIIKLGSYTLEVYQNDKEEYRWRIKASNGENIASSNEGFSSKAACLNNLKSIKKALANLED